MSVVAIASCARCASAKGAAIHSVSRTCFALAGRLTTADSARVMAGFCQSNPNRSSLSFMARFAMAAALARPMCKAMLHAPLPIPPHPPFPTRQRTQLESFLVLRRNPLELWGKLAYEEEILPGKFLGRQQLMVNAPDAIRHVLVGNAANYQRNSTTKRVLQPVLGDGLFLAEGDAWRHQRRTIAPALAPRTMPILAKHVVAATAAAEDQLAQRQHRPIELLPHLQHLALAIAGQSMFSLEMRGFADELRGMLLGYGRQFAQPGVLDLMLPPRFSSAKDRGRQKFREKWLVFLDRLIAARTAMPQGEARDLFDLLSQARDPETGAGFDHAQLRDEVATMILAGHETTAVTLFWAVYLAALYPGPASPPGSGSRLGRPLRSQRLGLARPPASASRPHRRNAPPLSTGLPYRPPDRCRGRDRRPQGLARHRRHHLALGRPAPPPPLDRP